MREFRTLGSVGAPGGRLPGRPCQTSTDEHGHTEHTEDTDGQPNVRGLRVFP